MSDSFAERLRHFRLQMGITQQQLASMMYMDRSTVARWENGTRIPDLGLLSRLAKCLGVEVSQLISEENLSPHTLSVIIVDDEPPILSGESDTLREVLPKAQISAFSRPSEALAYAKSNYIDLAFLDIEMGKVNGFELCEKLLEINPGITVIFLTAFPDYALSAWNTGARGYMVKPLDAKEMTEQLKKLKITIPIGNLEKPKEAEVNYD